MPDLKPDSLSYTLQRQQRRSIAIHVLPGGQVVVKAPLHTSTNTIQAFIQQKSHWINSKRQLLLHVNNSSNQNWHLPMPWLFLGKYYTIIPIRFPLTCKICLEDNVIKIYAAAPMTSLQMAKRLQQWTDQQLAIIFPEHVHTIWQKHFANIPLPKLNWKQLRRRWGSYNRRQHLITLNKNLILAPLVCLDYVIIHEFCHCYHYNHSPNFYRLLSSILPQWKEYKGLLEYGIPPSPEHTSD